MGICKMELEVNKLVIESERLPKEFDGFRIAHVSDLHNVQMGGNNQRLIRAINDYKPNIIAITGDLIDSRRTKPNISLDFIGQAVEIAKCFYVPGNHEARISEYPNFKKALADEGVILLENTAQEIMRGQSHITLLGVKDSGFDEEYTYENSPEITRKNLEKLELQDGYNILLIHRPEPFEDFVLRKTDLVLAGHTHGGQIRLPFMAKNIRPDSRRFTKCGAGVFEKDGTTMIVSRGIGTSVLPIRFRSPPEVILIELKSRV